jgi:rod shape-determining protein MreC
VAAVVFSLALAVVDHRYHHLESVRSALSVVLYPVVYLADLPISAARSVRESFATRQQLRDRNQILNRENLRLRARLQQLESLEAENMRLRDLVGSSFKIGDRVLIAELLSVDLDPYRQQVLVDKGSLAGIFPGQPVLDAHAVMGQVTHVTPMTSTVLLITDASHALPVQVDRNGLRSIAFGTGRIHELELPHLPNNADIREGDQLVTSGLGGRFPPGYPVARVSRIEHRPGEPFASIVATPSAHLERSREVLLVWTLASTLAEAEAAARAEKGFAEEPPETPTGPAQIPAESSLP